MQCPRQRKWPPPREIPSAESSTIYSTGMYLYCDKEIAVNAWLLEPDVNSNNSHSNCHSHPRWRRPDPSVIEEYILSIYVCCKIIASNVQQTEPNDWQAIILLLLQ